MLIAMGIKERFPRVRGKREKPFVPDKLQNHILRVGDIWTMEGTPWWTGFVIGLQVERDTEKTVGPGPLLVKIHELERKGALTSLWGGRINHNTEPLREVPVLGDTGEIDRYYRVTDEGRRVRGAVGESKAKSGIVGKTVPKTS